MALIPQDIIDQIIDRADIISIISGYIPLKPAGRNFKANCPFHHEKTPSFVVNPDKQIFHCFGCGVGGNVISFVMKQERMDFPEALRFLAEKTGVVIPQTQAAYSPEQDLRKQVYQVNALAVQFYHRNLLSDKSPLADTARNYLKARGLSLEMVDQFQLGLALDAWDGLLKHLRAQNYSPAFLEKAGLAIAQSKGDGHYDRFRQRILFPIYDHRGQAVAFGARSLEKDNPAKYINSPETPVYTKGRYLYGLNWAKEAISAQDAAIVVEGYMDFMTPFSAGVHNIVASLGTALTTDQIRLLRRYTKNVIMLFDADAAGQAAMVRSLDALIEEGMSVKVAALTEDEDPDSYVRKYGAQSFAQRISDAESLFDFKLKFTRKLYPSGTIEDNAKVAGEMLSTIAKFDNAIVREEYLKQLSRALLVSPDALKTELKKRSVPLGTREQAAPAPRGPEPVRQVERSILQLLLQEKDFVSLSIQEVGLADFQNRHVREIVQKIYELFEGGRDVNAAVLMSSFENREVLDIISGIVASEEFLVGDKQKIYRDCKERLRQESLKTKRQELLRRMELARSKGDHATLEQLTHDFNQLVKMKGP